MGEIERAIKDFRRKLHAVYTADKERIMRDARAAERAARDHTGRWLFELLQNSDDAEASWVRVVVEGGVVYVADKGSGLKPRAVSAICGTDCSDKTSGTIGRKGVGFKSVYEVSSNPQVLTVDGEGIEFSPQKAGEWLRLNNFDDTHVPHQWIPFFVPWSEALRQDQVLESFSDCRTVVRLSGLSSDQTGKIRQVLDAWPPYALFAFRHIRRIEAPNIKIAVTPHGDTWQMLDSRGDESVSWLVAKKTESPPAELLEPLGLEERRAIIADGVSLLIAAPTTNDRVAPTEDYLPIHVFYPTEQTGPVRLLLHAEFLVKSDRTELLPIDGNSFNAWVAERLACHICEFVNRAYRPESPSSHASLLVPFDDRESHPVTQNLWQRIVDIAQADLRLADTEGQQCLTVDDARVISVSVRPDLARTLLEGTSMRGRLLHAAFDENKEARKALRELGCREIRDQDLMVAIAENTDSLSTNAEWIWACWEWLTTWVAKEPYGEEHKKRIERVKALPIVPVNGSLLKALDLAGRIVTWRPGAGLDNLPDWLPLTFVEDWFRDRIQTVTEEEPSVNKLCADLGIRDPGVDVIQRAVGRAIEQYWRDPQGDAQRFLRFILEQDWPGTSRPLSSLRRCPISIVRIGASEPAWSEAKCTYYGHEWGNHVLPCLYDGNSSIAWAQPLGEDAERERTVLAWLGCSDVPRIVEDHKKDDHAFDLYALPAECREWQTRSFGYTERSPTLDHISRLESIAVKDLSDAQVRTLLELLANHWEVYYKGHAQTRLSWFYYTARSRAVPAFWWYTVLHEIRPPAKMGSAPCALVDCWLPDKQTERAIGDLLPIINLDVFGNNKDTVRDWLIGAASLRTRIEQVNLKEWKQLLSACIPAKAPVERLESDERLRDAVAGWYSACLETVAAHEDISEKAFASCPLLCRKGDSWQYVVEELRYLDDDNDLAKAFAEDVWLFDIPTQRTPDAVKYFGVLRLSKSVQVEVIPGDPKSPLSEGLSTRFNESLPYIWAWRSSRSKQPVEKLSSSLKKLKVDVVPTLKANLDLEGVRREIERRWHVIDDVIFLHGDHVNEAELAQALAKVVDVRSEADFYENLLRCNSHLQRKEKLLSKGIADAEVERCLRKYSGCNDPQEQDAREEPLEAERQEQQPSPQAPAVQPPTPMQRKTPKESEAAQKPVVPPPASLSRKPLVLKDAAIVDYVLSGAPLASSVSRGDAKGGGASNHETDVLTEEERAQVEEAGRRIARRELERMGYTVENMPQENPGFDLRAMKGATEFRVEVKAHTGKATVVDVTQRQYREYLGQQGYRWELWNVERLAEYDAERVAITRYENIPDDALDARTFRVDLRKCQTASSAWESQGGAVLFPNGSP